MTRHLFFFVLLVVSVGCSEYSPPDTVARLATSSPSNAQGSTASTTTTSGSQTSTSTVSGGSTTTSGSMSNAGSSSSIQTMPRAVTYRNFILGLYLTMYGRAADPEGYDYWLTQLGVSRVQAVLLVPNDAITFLANSFAANTAFDNSYGSISNSQFVEALYLNSSRHNSDPAGLAYWTDSLNSLVATGFSIKNARATICAQFVVALLVWDASKNQNLQADVLQLAIERQAVFFKLIDNQNL